MNIWSNCKRIPLPNVLSFIVDNRGKTVPTDDNGSHKLIATNCIKNENLYPTYEKIRLLSDDTYNTWFRAHPVPGDIIFVCKGTPGRTCLVPDPIDFCIAQDMVALRCNDQIIYNKYLLAILRSREIQEQITNTSVGDVIPHFKKQFFDQLMIPIPPMDIQKKIGDLYFELSASEDLCKRINENLEQEASAIFQEFFFSDNAITGLKSDSLSSIATFLNGLPMQKYRPDGDDEGLPVLKIRELRQGFVDNNTELCARNIKPEYIVEDGDVIFSWSGSLLVDFWCGGTCGLNQHLFKVSSDNFDKWFYYSWTKHHLDRFIAIAADKATTMGHIKRDELDKAEVFIPNSDDYEKIGAILEPIYDSIIANRLKARILGEIRDMLIPNMMLGKEDLSDLNI